MQLQRPLRRRRAITAGLSAAVLALLIVGDDHRVEHMVRSIVLPGAGLVGANNAAAVAFLVGAVAATVAWVRWGMDWLVVAVVAAAVVASGLVGAPRHDHSALGGGAAPVAPAAAAHEFPLVLLVAGALSWFRGIAARLPLVASLARRRSVTASGLASVDMLRPTDRSRTAAVLALAGEKATAAAIAADPAIARRARRVGAWARLRCTGDPLRVDHAHARAALIVADAADTAFVERFVAESDQGLIGVPCSEPTWVRPFDGTLAALAAQCTGHGSARWAEALAGPFHLRRGHRPAWYWTPLGWAAGAAPPWEHAASTALARAVGWISDDDWPALRTRALGASARGVAHPHDERLIAAARIWLVFVDDSRASALLARPTVRHDPLAVALNLLAARLAASPNALLDPPSELQV